MYLNAVASYYLFRVMTSAEDALSPPSTGGSKQVFTLFVGMIVGYFIKSAEESSSDPDTKYLIKWITRVASVGTLVYLWYSH